VASAEHGAVGDDSGWLFGNNMLIRGSSAPILDPASFVAPNLCACPGVWSMNILELNGQNENSVETSKTERTFGQIQEGRGRGRRGVGMDGHAPRQLCDAVYPGRTSHTCLQSPDIDPQGLPCSIELQYSVLIYPLTLFEF
jgi:hypothetical protein